MYSLFANMEVNSELQEMYNMDNKNCGALTKRDSATTLWAEPLFALSENKTESLYILPMPRVHL